MFTYHYCTQYHGMAGEIYYCDGIAILKEKIKTMEDYRKLKIGIDPDNAHKLTVTSLTLI